MQQIMMCNGFRMRSIEMHNAQLQNIALDETLSSIYGVKFDSVLNKLDHFPLKVLNTFGRVVGLLLLSIRQKGNFKIESFSVSSVK
jgi:hypothetical protein